MVDHVNDILATGGIWGLYLYIILKDLIPKLFPSLLKSYNKRIWIEDRLFTIITENNKYTEHLAISLSSLAEAIASLSHRVEKIEDFIKECSKK